MTFRLAALQALALACTATSSGTTNGSTPPPPEVRLYPTRAGGREWKLPGDADKAGPEWRPGVPVTKVAPGVFHTAGSTSTSVLGEVRMEVHSPAQAAWWRNVEVTWYLRQTGDVATSGQVPHWELTARGERQTGSVLVPFSSVNDGVPAPAGTATWPWYPLAADAQVNAPCLGTTYHGNVYVTGRVHFEKELSHVDGYNQESRASATARDLYVTDLPPTLNRWFGMKFVLRNAAADTRAHLELWLDVAASGAWRKVAEVDDDPSNPWVARTTTMNGCVNVPYSYALDQLVTWAGPWLVFRSDALAMDFRDLSAREIDPL